MPGPAGLRRRAWLLAAAGVLIVGVLAAGAPARAQTPECEDPDTVVCIPTTAPAPQQPAGRAPAPSLLRPYWSQDALSNLRRQIDWLRSSNSYQVLRLVSIQVLGVSGSQYGAWVHTSEHWIWQSWSYDGYMYDAADAWYDNQ